MRTIHTEITYSALLLVCFLLVVFVLAGCAGEMKVGKSAWMTGYPAGNLGQWTTEVMTCAEASDVPVPKVVVYDEGAELVMCDDKEYVGCLYNDAIHIPQKMNESDYRHLVLHYAVFKKTGIPDTNHESPYWGVCAKASMEGEYVKP